MIDLVGYGTTALTYETSPTATLSATSSARRTDETADGDNNGADFTVGDQTPTACSACATPPPAGGDKTIAEIQGTDAAESPLVGATVTTRGVVTATYPTGGLNGIYIQTAGTGGATDATPGASDAVFVFGANSGAADLQLGDFVAVTGPVSEFAGTTEITPAAGGVTLLTGDPSPVTALSTGLPETEADKEAHEGELLAPTGPFTVTNTFPTNQFAEIWLAAQDGPLVQGTELFDAQGTDDNDARGAEPPAPGRARRRRQRQLPQPRQPGHPAPVADPDPVDPGGRRRNLQRAGDPRVPQQRVEVPAAATGHGCGYRRRRLHRQPAR